MRCKSTERSSRVTANGPTDVPSSWSAGRRGTPERLFGICDPDAHLPENFDAPVAIVPRVQKADLVPHHNVTYLPVMFIDKSTRGDVSCECFHLVRPARIYRSTP